MFYNRLFLEQASLVQSVTDVHVLLKLIFIRPPVHTCFGLLMTPVLYPNCVLDPTTAADTDSTSRPVSAPRPLPFSPEAAAAG